MSKTKKDIEELSAEELYALARKREKEEAERQEKKHAKSGAVADHPLPEPRPRPWSATRPAWNRYAKRWRP